MSKPANEQKSVEKEIYRNPLMDHVINCVDPLNRLSEILSFMSISLNGAEDVLTFAGGPVMKTTEQKATKESKYARYPENPFFYSRGPAFEEINMFTDPDKFNPVLAVWILR